MGTPARAAVQRGLRIGEVRLSTPERHPEVLRIDLDEQRAGLDLLVVSDVHGQNRPADTRRNRRDVPVNLRIVRCFAAGQVPPDARDGQRHADDRREQDPPRPRLLWDEARSHSLESSQILSRRFLGHAERARHRELGEIVRIQRREVAVGRASHGLLGLHDLEVVRHTGRRSGPGPAPAAARPAPRRDRATFTRSSAATRSS